MWWHSPPKMVSNVVALDLPNWYHGWCMPRAPPVVRLGWTPHAAHAPRPRAPPQGKHTLP